MELSPDEVVMLGKRLEHVAHMLQGSRANGATSSFEHFLKEAKSIVERIEIAKHNKYASLEKDAVEATSFCLGCKQKYSGGHICAPLEKNVFVDGDMPDCPVRCDKCKQLRLRRERETPPNWCRRCKYENFDEYFGAGGSNEQKSDERG